MNHSTKMRRALVLGMTVGGIATVGCKTDWMHRTERGPEGPTMARERVVRIDPEKPTATVSVIHQEEVDLVEAVIGHRLGYQQSLEQLRNYYKLRGYTTKQDWAEFELKGFKSVKPFLYLMDAEVPAERLRPMDQISEADELYERGVALMKKGGHGIPVLYREKPMIEASQVFRDLIVRYPSSDKIDDAAFFLGEIHKEYFPNQDVIAVEWYERAWTWDPNTPHSARFQAAVVYDFRLHDRDRALELYRIVMQDETRSGSNVAFAARRIEQLTAGQHEKTADSQ